MQVAVLGTGLMGLAMAQKLLADKVSVVAYNRTPEKMEPLRIAGAVLANSPEEALAQCDCAIAMLSNAKAIREVLLSERSRPHLQGRTIIQMGTIAPSESRGFASQIAQFEGEYFEAPVLGSIPQVKSGNLQVMVGGTPGQCTQWSEFLKHFGEPRRIGEVGEAAALKLALNQLIASLTTAFSLSLGFVQRQGVDVDTFMEILRDSALYAPTFDKKLSRMSDRNFDNPNFPTKHLLKDTDLFLAEARAIGLEVGSLEGVREIINMAIDRALSDADYSALFNAVNPPSEES